MHCITANHLRHVQLFNYKYFKAEILTCPKENQQTKRKFLFGEKLFYRIIDTDLNLDLEHL